MKAKSLIALLVFLLGVFLWFRFAEANKPSTDFYDAIFALEISDETISESHSIRCFFTIKATRESRFKIFEELENTVFIRGAEPTIRVTERIGNVIEIFVDENDGYVFECEAKLIQREERQYLDFQTAGVLDVTGQDKVRLAWRAFPEDIEFDSLDYSYSNIVELVIASSSP